jgi:maltooligosyltrehalose trehalohydrolase
MKKHGAYLDENGSCTFRVWAPLHDIMILHIHTPQEQLFTMEKDEEGYFAASLQGITAGTRYTYRPGDENDFPDPASFAQPEGVHGPSMVIHHPVRPPAERYWEGMPLESMIFYEVHVGTFTEAGTFEAVIERLDDLIDLGVTALELMPVAQFPGERNWGYDGVYPYAVQNSYGGVEQLKALVEACHQKGLAVFLDAVYNHLGPEGNYLEHYGPYFTDHYKTPWGKAINLDGPWCDGVRDYFAENILYWFANFDVDGLRLDAIHAIYDNGAEHFWAYARRRLEALEQETGRRYYLVAESDSNMPRVIQPTSHNGFGFDAQWLDDFHHMLYVLLDKEHQWLYKDYRTYEQAVKAYEEGFVFSGEYVEARKRKHGLSSAGISGSKFVVFNQNHDQVGNRIGSKRLSAIVNNDRLLLAAAALLLSPYIPLLFMGEEYGEQAPFFYFTHHSDQELIAAVRKGRSEEFAYNFDTYVPPDPQHPDTFSQSKLKWREKLNEEQEKLLAWYKTLIRMRKELPQLQCFDKDYLHVATWEDAGLVLIRRGAAERELLLVLLKFEEEEKSYLLPVGAGAWWLILSSGDRETDTMFYPGDTIAVSGVEVLVFKGTPVNV